MRLLHARHDHDRARAAHRGAGLRCRPRARGPVRQYLPLHRLHLDRRGGAGGARGLSQAGRPGMRNSFVGAAIERREDLRFLRGRGQYVDDLARKGVLHAVILRSAVAHGRIRSIDAADALKMPGVHAVITAKDMAGEPPVIAATKVRYVGEPVAVVLADSVALGEDALEAIHVDIEPLPAVSDRGKAENGDSLLFEAHGTNVALTFSAVRGDADAVFKTAPYTRRERFRT